MKFKDLRKEKNLTQTEIAKQIGIPRLNYNKYELEQVEPKIDTLIKIANFYNVSLDYICERPFNNGIGYIPAEKKELVKEIIELDKEEIQRIEDFINGMKSNKNETTTFTVFKKDR